MRYRLSLLLLVAFALAVLTTVSHAQTTSAPLLSWQRVSIGVGGDFVAYRPSLLEQTKQEFRGVLPVSYNLGKHASLTARWTVGTVSWQKEYAVGFVLHLLARGKVVTP